MSLLLLAFIKLIIATMHKRLAITIITTIIRRNSETACVYYTISMYVASSIVASVVHPSHCDGYANTHAALCPPGILLRLPDQLIFN